QDHVEQVVKIENLAQFTYDKLKSLDRKKKLWIQRTAFALTIRMKSPNKDLVFKYSLSEEELYVNGKKRKYAHIYIMSHVTKELIDSFIGDLKKSGYFEG
ncbi:MAG: pyridoxal-dependent decarboxylase, partial [Planctomycetota bacterium]